ncbi:class I adenylate-forming enzyme family protein [Rhodoligotrophos defluvii]|uniref:class I adenylate-forming enzyme family protein n=1 Tax=Rhodoligotrophos defluvii TaxID=2561934 RepID=UPI0010C995A8|nr:AMP-binding protein [Rhodoligotrophos defluvii]
MVWGNMPDGLFARTTVEMLEKHAERQPDRQALVARSCSRGEIRLTYAALKREVDRLADGLRRLGVAPKDRVAILMDNQAGCEAMVSMLAIHRLCGVFVPLNARYAPDEIAYVLDKAECSTVIAAGDQLDKLARVRPRLSALKHVVALSGGAPGTTAYGEVFAAGEPAAAGWPEVTADDMCDILFTSGTTAHPKGAVMTHGRAAVSAQIFVETLRLRPNDIVQSFFPCFVTAGPRCVVLPAWWAGASAVMDPAMELEDVLARIRRERTTMYYAVPSFYIFLLETFDRGRHDIASIRQFTYGGAAMSREIIERLAQVFPGIDLMQTYGATEMGPSGTVLNPDHALTKLGSIGQPMPRVAVRLLNDEGQDVAVGETGEIAIKAPCVMREYYKEPENTAAAFRGEWFLSGDLGRMDEDGFYYHVDRKKDMIIRGGHNIGSMEIESVLFQHPAVAEAAAVAVPHPKLGEDIQVFVVCRSGMGPSAEELMAFCRERLADYKVPRRISFIAEMPRNPMGKILKTRLREMARDMM